MTLLADPQALESSGLPRAPGRGRCPWVPRAWASHSPAARVAEQVPPARTLGWRPSRRFHWENRSHRENRGSPRGLRGAVLWTESGPRARAGSRGCRAEGAPSRPGGHWGGPRSELVEQSRGKHTQQPDSPCRVDAASRRARRDMEPEARTCCGATVQTTVASLPAPPPLCWRRRVCAPLADK